MFDVNHVFAHTKSVVHVKLGDELDYGELVAIREEVGRKCSGCPKYVAIYDYQSKPTFQNFSLTSYRKMNALKLDIIINLGMNPVQRSFAKLVHRIKPASRSIYFANTYEEAISLAKSLLPDYFNETETVPC